ncbi:MAG TPA: ASCH domain-containing protein [Tepidisphaeraceae bacterium]|jgi:hypothetical protein|nr:ASCH domain-containing protein [Tepidisphaeraceae bacterium]
MKAISLWQPWATLIAVGAKRIETRSWSTHYRGRLAIHAAKRWPRELSDLCVEPGPIREALERSGHLDINAERMTLSMPVGVVVGTCYLADVFPVDAGSQYYRIGGDAQRSVTLPPAEPELSFGDYTPGRFAWILTEIVALPKPVPFRGAQGFFDVPDDLLKGGSL